MYHMYHMCPWPFWLKPEFATLSVKHVFQVHVMVPKQILKWYFEKKKKGENFCENHKFEATNLRQFLKWDNAASNGSAEEPNSGLDGAKRSRICTKLRQDGAKFREDAINLSQCGTESGQGGSKLSRHGKRLHQEAARLKQNASKLSQDGDNLGRGSAKRSQDGTKRSQSCSSDPHTKLDPAPGRPKRGTKVEKVWKNMKLLFKHKDFLKKSGILSKRRLHIPLDLCKNIRKMMLIDWFLWFLQWGGV